MRNARGLGWGDGWTRRLALAGVALSASVAGGCVWEEPASPNRLLVSERAEPLPASAWPERDQRSVEAVLASIGPTARIHTRSVEREKERLVPIDETRTFEVVNKLAVGQGLILDVRPPGVARGSPGTLVFSSVGGGMPLQDDGAADAGAQSEQGALSGIVFRITEPLGGVAVRGIVFHLHGLGGIEYEQSVADALLRAGFMVLQAEFPWQRWRQRRIELGTEAELEAVAGELAAMSDDCQAEMAYAAEAAVDYLWETRPALRGTPVVVTGFSAGSLTGCTIAARLGGRVAAVVLAGSGSNVAHIVQTSDLTNGGVNIARGGQRVRGSLAGLVSGRYLVKSRLDPYHTAAQLRRVPTLLIHASADDIVPADTGEELYERLGRPERWVVTGGHRTLFLRLGTLAEQIAAWVDRAVAQWAGRSR